jgi:Ca2+-binding EF-hand superfamily protein
MFQYSEQGGIPLRELRRRLQDYGLAEHMPAGKAELMIRKADEDKDGVLDYEEFVRLVRTTKTHYTH